MKERVARTLASSLGAEAQAAAPASKRTASAAALASARPSQTRKALTGTDGPRRRFAAVAPGRHGSWTDRRALLLRPMRLPALAS
jgi:hypothetical protein